MHRKQHIEIKCRNVVVTAVNKKKFKKLVRIRKNLCMPMSVRL